MHPDQPTPTPTTGDLWLDLLDDWSMLLFPTRLYLLAHDRRLLGIARYGTPLQRGNGRDMRRDAREEALDLAVYLWALGWRWTARVVLVVAWRLR